MPENPNDPLSGHVLDAGRWGDPSQPLDDPGALGATIERTSYDYSGGVLVGPDPGAIAVAQPPPLLYRERTDLPPSYQAPHEATHRRYEPPQLVRVAQAAAGFTLIAAPNLGLHYIKVLAAFLTLDAAGTLRFVQGSADGTNVASMTGDLNMGGAAVPPLQLAPAETANPWLFTSSDQGLGIFTVTGKAQGWLIVCMAPYES